MKHLRIVLLIGSVALLGAMAAAARQTDPATFAMADIHGDYASMAELLAQVGVADEEGRWAGGDATFIQTGDYMDRGPEVRRVLDFLMRLEHDAPDGRVIVLLGNHEIMNMLGDLRDTTDADYLGFVDDGSERRRQEGLEEYLAYRSRRQERLGLPETDGVDAEQEWLDSHPPGFLERQLALSARGEYGRWLRERPVVVEHDDILFMHAGISPALSELSIRDINERVHAELDAFDRAVAYLAEADVILPFFTLGEIIDAVEEEREAASADPPSPSVVDTAVLEAFLGIGSWLSLHPQGVMWFRGYAEWSDEEGAPLIEQLLDAYGVDHIVVGHTPQAGGRIRSRFGGRLYLADTGMLASRYPGGQASILEIRDGMFTAVYRDASVRQ